MSFRAGPVGQSRLCAFDENGGDVVDRGDVFEGVAGTATMSASLPGSSVPVVSAIPHTSAGTDVVAARACAFVMPIRGRNPVTPWGSTSCGLFGPTPASLLQTMRAPAPMQDGSVVLDGAEPLTHCRVRRHLSR